MRLLSYNIHKGIGGRDGRYRFDRVVSVIRAEEPDLICLQEVDRGAARSRYDDQPALLAEALRPAAALYQQNVMTRRGGGYGNLVLSRWPLRATHQVSIRKGRRRPRGAQLLVVETPRGALHLVQWHLGLAETERHWQAAHLLDHPLFRESAGLPTLVVGDFNDWRNTLAAGPFARHGFQHWTAPRSRFRSFPALLPVLALDKAFARGALELDAARVVRSPMARVASDHLPLEVDFHIAPG